MIAEGRVFIENGCENGPTPVMWNPEIEYNEELAKMITANDEFFSNTKYYDQKYIISMIKKLYPELIEKVETFVDHYEIEKEVITLKKSFFLDIDFVEGKKYKIIEVD